MNLLLFIAILSLLIFVHEAGHFAVAKRAGIRVLEFGFGLPPRLIGKKIGETIYSINLLPIGGFVRLFGEDAEELADARRPEKRRLGTSGAGEATLKRAFFTQPKRVRVAVVIAGVIMNFLLGVILFSGLYTVIGIPTQTDAVLIIGIAPDSPAFSAFEIGDEVVSAAGVSVDSTVDFKRLVDERREQEIVFEILRQETLVTVHAVPRLNPPEEEGSLGVVISPRVELVRFPIWQMPFRGAWLGLGEALGWGMTIVRGLGGILSQLVSGVVPKDIGGPFEIYFLVSEVAAAGVVPLVQLVAILSVNLAIVNLLPIPALDGGRLLFIGVEAVTGKKLSARAERLTHAIGMAFLLALMLAISVQDVLRRSGAESLGALLERVTQM
ncbi:site-2 protease family protein [Patescibacteria group bacterium]|nr:site-2 protease family protein [Patescibacteria group bacterium]